MLLWSGVAVLILVISKKILCMQWVIWRFWFLSEEVWEMIYLTCIKLFSSLRAGQKRQEVVQKKNRENSAPLLLIAQLRRMGGLLSFFWVSLHSSYSPPLSVYFQFNKFCTFLIKKKKKNERVSYNVWE